MSKTGVEENVVDKTKQKTKKEIKKQKNVLFNPFPYKWPVIEKYFEERILDELQSLLESLPLKMPKRPLSYFKGKKGKDGKLQQTEEEKKKDEERKELRSQIVCGVREVTKGLERNNLDLIIVCRSTQPSIITKHLIPLAAGRSCSALCISEFNRKISPLLGVTSLVAIGFKKKPSDDVSKFEEFVKYAKSKAPAIEAPWVEDIHKTLEESVASQDQSNVSKAQSEDEERHLKGENPSISKIKSDYISLSPSKDEVNDRNKKSDSSNFYVKEGKKSESSKTDTFISLSPIKDKTQTSKSSVFSAGGKSRDSGFLSLSTESIPESRSVDSTGRNETNTDNINRKPELIFPLDGPPPFVPRNDYSHLYVFKRAGKFGDDFISFGDSKGKKRDLSLISSESESESVEEEVSGILGIDEPVAKKHKYSNKSRHPPYRPASIRTQIPNPNKKKKKNKSK